MILYTHPFSPTVRAVLLTAAHLGLDLDIRVVDAAAGEQRSEAYLKLNPNGQFPVLVDGDFVLWESIAIEQYLASKRPSTLWPEDPRSRADIVRWQAWAITRWATVLRPFIFENAAKPLMMGQQPDANAVAAAIEPFHRAAAILNSHLETREWLVGDALTLADFAVGAELMHKDAAEIPISTHSSVSIWFDRLRGLHAWSATEPEPFGKAA